MTVRPWPLPWWLVPEPWPDIPACGVRLPAASQAAERVYEYNLPPKASPWGVATIDLKTPECSHHKLFLSHYLQHEGGNSHDDRSGRMSARPPVGQACPR